ncbi:mechanosensitive ion channel family protein [Elusimicrobiota bacterium]
MINNFVSKVFFNNTMGEYIFSLGAFLFLLAVICITKMLIINRLEKWAEKTETKIDDFIVMHIRKTLIPLLIVGAFILSIDNLKLNETITQIIHIGGIIFFIFMSLKFIMSFLDYFLDTYFKKHNTGETRQRTLKWVSISIKTALVGIAVVVLLDNMGIKISTLVAGLGIGGVAVALASQAILGDLFSFFVIMFDRPFEKGDFIVVDDLMGTVEHIGVKTTRLRSIGGEELIFSNTALTNARVRNYKRMARRRVVFKLSVTHGTSLEQMKQIPEIIKNILATENDAVFDRAHFFSYGDFALIYEVVYNVLTSDYYRYMDIQQDINFKIKEEFDKRKINFAYPTQTLFINKTN